MSVAKPTLAACTAVALATCACGFSLVCTAIGCISGAHVKVNRVFNESEAESLDVTACWQAKCASGHLTPPTSGPGTGRSTHLSANGLSVDTILWVRSNGYELEMDIQVLRELGAPYSLRDGDVYAVKVSGPGGTVLLDERRAARYGEWYPNGQACDKDPCRETSLQLP